MKRKIKVVIDRSKWRTGGFSSKATGAGITALLNDEGYMCCLGFCMAASKVAKKDLLCIASPPTLMNTIKSDSKKLGRVLRSNGVRALASLSLSDYRTYISTDLTSNAMNINDSHDTTPKQKEKAILELFRDSVFDLEFIGEYTKEKNEQF
jgi:hypothetical protein